MNKHIKMILFTILSNGSEIDSNVYGTENQFQLWVLGVYMHGNNKPTA